MRREKMESNTAKSIVGLGLTVIILAIIVLLAGLVEFFPAIYFVGIGIGMILLAWFVDAVAQEVVQNRSR